MSNHCPIYESRFLEQSIEVFLRISKLVEDKGAIDKIGNDKRAIQNEKSLRRSMLIEVMGDDPNGLTSLRSDRLDVRRPMINWR